VGTTNSKPPGRIIMMGEWESPSNSQIIFIILFSAGAQPCWRCSKVTDYQLKEWRCSKMTSNSRSGWSVTTISTYFTTGSIECMPSEVVVGPVQLLGDFSQVFTSFIPI
jgi:hypothetical protein